MASGLKTAALLGGAERAADCRSAARLGGQSGLVIAFGIAVVMNVGSYWFSDKIVLRMYKAHGGRDRTIRSTG